MKRHNPYNSENGSIFIYILIAIALFASLTYAIGRDKGGSSDIFTKEQAKIAAQEIIEYGNLVVSAVQKLRLRGCQEIELNFENDFHTGYTNANSPADNSCHIFHPNGGNISFRNNFNEDLPQVYYISAFIEGVGSNDSKELMMLLRLQNEKTCHELNRLLDVGTYGTIPGTDAITWVKFTGNFNDSGDFGSVSHTLEGIPEIVGKTAACYGGVATEILFYQTLLIR